jgi:hypothetical protein
MRDLYEIESELKWLNGLSEEYSEEWDLPLDPTEQRVADITKRIEHLQIDRDRALAGLCKAVKNLEAEQEAFKLEQKRLEKREKAAEYTIGYLKEVISHSVGPLNKWESEDKLHKIGWRKSERLESEQDAEVPECFREIQYKIKRAEIKQSIKEGAVIPGWWIKVYDNLQVK